MVMSAGSPLGRWAAKNCTLFKAGNICKKPIQSMVQPTPEPIVPDLNASCAPGWVSQEDFPYCYKVRVCSKVGLCENICCLDVMWICVLGL